MFNRRKARPYPGPLAGSDAIEFTRAVGLDQSVQVWRAVECIQWDGRLAGHTREDCKLSLAPTTTHLVLTPRHGQHTHLPISELAVGVARFGTQAFVLIRDPDGKSLTLSMANKLAQSLIELLISLGASQVSSPKGKSVAQSGSAAWSQ